MKNTNKIIRIVNEEIGVDCTSITRKRSVTDARFLAMYFIWKTGSSKNATAKIFNKNHASVINAIKKVDIFRKVDAKFDEHYRNINAKLKINFIEKKENVLKEIFKYCPDDLIRRYHDAI